MKNRRIGPIKRMAKKEIQKEIKIQERRERRKLDREEKIEIKNEVLRKMRVKASVLGAIGILGIGGIIGYNVNQNSTKTLPEGNVIETDNERNSREIFIDGIRVELPEEANIEENSIQQEVNELETSEEILNYTKQKYVDQYNKNNEEKINVEDVRFYKSSFDKVFYEDKAENGDTILRYCNEKQAKENGIPIDGNTPMIQVTIAKETGSIAEEVAQKSNGDIVNVYGRDEIVQQDKENTLTQLGDVVLSGINFSTAIEQEENSWKVKDDYKQRFVKAIANFEKEQKENTKTTNKNVEIDYEQGI